VRYRKIFEKLYYAMFCRTQEHFIKHIMADMDALPAMHALPKNNCDSIAYITKEWLDTQAQLTLWA